MSPTSINFKRIKKNEPTSLDSIFKKISNTKYNEKDGFGFVVKSEDPNHIQGYLIIDCPSFTTSFDPENVSIVKTKIIKKIAIEFLIDLEYNLLEVYSDKSSTNRVISELGKLSKFSFVVEDIQFKAIDVINKIKRSNYPYTIKNLRIRDFSINEYTRGSFFVNILAKPEGERLIKEYNHLITYVGLNYSVENEDISIGLYDSGSLRLFSNLDISEEIILKFKEIFFKSEV